MTKQDSHVLNLWFDPNMEMISLAINITTQDLIDITIDSKIGYIPSLFPPLFSASSQRNVFILISPGCACQHVIDINVTGKLFLKWIENTLACTAFEQKENSTVNKNLKPAIKWRGSNQGKIAADFHNGNLNRRPDGFLIQPLSATEN